MSEVVILMGCPAAGKTSLLDQFKGHRRINRDLAGGSLDGLLPLLDQSLSEHADVVMDNTYGTRANRAPVVAMARKRRANCLCVWLDTSIEDAQVNACLRMIDRFGKVLTPEEIKATKDPNAFPAAALFAWWKKFEEPSAAEGFDSIERVSFRRRPQGPRYDKRAIILDYDDTLRVTRSGEKYPTRPDDVDILPNRIETLKRYKSRGYLLLGASNQSGVAKGAMTMEVARACFEATNKLLGFDIDYRFCPHSPAPITCYCRKPMPGQGMELVEKHKLNKAEVIMVGDQTSDKTFARRCGFAYHDQAEFFR